MKYLSACAVFFLLVFCGGLASRVFFEQVVKKDMAADGRRLLLDAGIDDPDERYDHIFVSLAGSYNALTKGPVTLHHIDGNVWGITKAEHISHTQTTFVASVKSDGTVKLEGEVPNAGVKADLVRAAKKAVGVAKVDNQLVVSEHARGPKWGESGPDFLEEFLSFSGVESVSADGRGITLEGEVNSREVREKIGELAAQLTKAPMVVNNNLTVKSTKPPVLILRGGEKGLSLSGLLPSEQVKKTVLSLVDGALSDANTAVDAETLIVSSGVAEPWWLGHAEQLVPAFLKETDGIGNLEYWKNHLLISGEVTDPNAVTSITTLASSSSDIPEGFSVENALSTVPSENPNIAIYWDSNMRLIIEGQLGSVTFKDQILSALIRSQPDLMVADRLRVKEEVRNIAWSNPTRLVTEIVGEAAGGMVRLTEKGIALSGQASTQKQIDSIEEAATLLVGDHGVVVNRIKLNASARPLHPTSLSSTATSKPIRASFSVVSTSQYDGHDFRQTAIYFKSGSSRLGTSDQRTIGNTASLIRKMDPSIKFVVGAYNDSKGDPAYTQEINEKRATAVRDELIRLGVSADRLVVKHYAVDTSKTSPEDYWKCQRVELSVVQG